MRINNLLIHSFCWRWLWGNSQRNIIHLQEHWINWMCHIKHTRNLTSRTNGRLCCNLAHLRIMFEPSGGMKGSMGWLESWMLHEQWRWHMFKEPRAGRGQREGEGQKWKVYKNTVCIPIWRLSSAGSSSTCGNNIIVVNEKKPWGPTLQVQDIVKVIQKAYSEHDQDQVFSSLQSNERQIYNCAVNRQRGLWLH